jgi:hypothetical protein
MARHVICVASDARALSGLRSRVGGMNVTTAFVTSFEGLLAALSAKSPDLVLVDDSVDDGYFNRVAAIVSPGTELQRV